MNPLRGRKIGNKISFLLKRLLRTIAGREPLKVFGPPGSRSNDRIEAVYIINLDRQIARWEIVKVEAHRQILERGGRLLDLCQRVPAVDGKLLDMSEVEGSVSLKYPLDAQYFVDPDPRLLTLIREKDVEIAMSREEVAVALSHIRAWQHVVAENRSHVLILEDDVFFEPNFASKVNRTWQELPRNQGNDPAFDLLYLSYREVERGAQWVDCSPNLRRPLRGYWWLSGYVLSNAGAKTLLERLPVVGPVDLWMNHLFSHLDVYSSPRSIIYQRTDLQSDNRYSILPLLSQIGVQSDKAHLVLEQTRGRRPIFCVGYDRRAAAVLESALSLLGYRCCNDRYGLLSSSVGRLLDDNLPLLFDGYVRVESVSRQVARVDKLHPGAVFILPSAAMKGGDLSVEEFRAVKTLLQDRRENVLEFDVRESAGWQSLCDFLRCSKPSYPFPANGGRDDVPDLLNGSTRLQPVIVRKLVVQEHDVHPWVVPYERMAAFGVLREARTHGTQAGVFSLAATDAFSSLDESRWTVLEDSFPSNLAVFRPENVSIGHQHGCRLTLDKKVVRDRTFSAASIRSKRSYRYGRFAVNMKPARASGVVTAFFLHRIDPWQEIDIELLGADTTKLLTNVYFNPGDPGAACNFGNRGTPVVIELGFDAADDDHEYAIEWEPHEMRWLVDDRLVHVRATWEPTPVPNLPMQLHCSIWPPRSVELAGGLNTAALPVSSEIRRIEIEEWHKAPAIPSDGTVERGTEHHGRVRIASISG